MEAWLPRVLGFTGGDNQGIIGLEVKYDEILKGKPGKILTTTDARGVELDSLGAADRNEPEAGKRPEDQSGYGISSSMHSSRR